MKLTRRESARLFYPPSILLLLRLLSSTWLLRLQPLMPLYCCCSCRRGTVFEIQAVLKRDFAGCLDKYRAGGRHQARWKKAVGVSGMCVGGVHGGGVRAGRGRGASACCAAPAGCLLSLAGLHLLLS